MDLTGENRVIVKEGLKRIRKTGNPGMRALILQNELQPENIRAYHIGFILGPCMNASGRLDTAKRSLALLNAESQEEAAELAQDLIQLNNSRKDMTVKGVEEAEAYIEREHLEEDRVMVVFLPDCHESLAGIIAGRIREKYNRPVFVLTRSEDGVKGSGRSIEEYSMYEELVKCRELFQRFGGHPMAAGLSMQEKDVPLLRRRLNENCSLTEEDLTGKIKIDAVVPLSYISLSLIEALEALEPFGKGNPKPVFAARDVELCGARVLGKNRNVLRLELKMDNGKVMKGVRFGDAEEMLDFFRKKYSAAQVENLLAGRPSGIRCSIIYYPKKDEYNGASGIQVVVSAYR